MNIDQIIEEKVRNAVSEAIQPLVQLLEQASMSNQKPTLTLEEAGSILGAGMNTMYELVRTPDFPCLKVGNKWMVLHQELHQWMRQRARKGEGHGDREYH
ncbi:helix-turn-helix domain-containing protein [Ectobacillus sp. JY-23]|uniref:helix-turn-helix domain-containing protein n=1 Tax=Ectobacillus sp. JY-23 TaxID=2933872 RepID=UPI001FF48DB7|nr:helix-turn-helix domain-containing protein [Ectobacillus sp. JY-23]UOY92874.1 helix-turn-helix domain-containing protein [Ectobacillus sp. JY-23]